MEGIDPQIFAYLLVGAVIWWGGSQVVHGVKTVAKDTGKAVHAVVHRTVKHPLGKTPKSEKK
jgi:hypothetical protein